MRSILLNIICLLGLLQFGCTEYLDEKPDQSLAIPRYIRDLQALMDYEDRMLMHYPAAGDVAADYYYLTEADWEARNVDVRNTYIWDENAQNRQDWTYGYYRIFYSNVVLDHIDKVDLGGQSETNRDNVKGQAYFFRGMALFQLAELYCPYYSIGMEDSEYGLPLQLESDINEPVNRSSVKETYKQIIEDLTLAHQYLPEKSHTAVRPSKEAAYALLARINLVIGDYEKGLKYADLALNIDNELIDYGELDANLPFPFTLLNKEVIFYGVTLGTASVHNQTRAKVDTLLFEKFKEIDLRKSLFFVKEGDKTIKYKGDYNATGTSIFGGLARDEVFLIKAECEVRLDKDSDARHTLNHLLKNRYVAGSYGVPDDLKSESLLSYVLEEREKQLLFRGGIRWSDLRRLNQDKRFEKTLQRKLGKELYELPPNDLRYTFLLPFDVVEISSLKQNPR